MARNGRGRGMRLAFCSSSDDQPGVALEQRLARRRAPPCPPTSAAPGRAAPGARRRQRAAPGVAEACRSAPALHGARPAARRRCAAHHRFGQVAAAQAAQRRASILAGTLATVNTSLTRRVRLTVIGRSAAPSRRQRPRGGARSRRRSRAPPRGPAGGAAPRRRRTPSRRAAGCRCRPAAPCRRGIRSPDRPGQPVSASHVPARTSVRRRSRVAGPAGGSSAVERPHSSNTVVREITPSTATVTPSPIPTRRRLTRLATASICASRRRPSPSSSAPAAVRRAWRELRSNSSTSSASSSWRTL